MKDGKATGEYTPIRHFEGYKDVLHGGIISSLLDEVMAYAVFSQGLVAVTTHMEVKFRKAAKIGEKLMLEGYIVSDRGKLILVEGKVSNPKNEIIATGKAKFQVESTLTGAYQVCVTDVTKAGWTYDPGQNVESCDSLTVQ